MASPGHALYLNEGGGGVVVTPICLTKRSVYDALGYWSSVVYLRSKALRGNGVCTHIYSYQNRCIYVRWSACTFLLKITPFSKKNIRKEFNWLRPSWTRPDDQCKHGQLFILSCALICVMSKPKRRIKLWPKPKAKLETKLTPCAEIWTSNCPSTGRWAFAQPGGSGCFWPCRTAAWVYRLYRLVIIIVAKSVFFFMPAW